MKMRYEVIGYIVDRREYFGIFESREAAERFGTEGIEIGILTDYELRNVTEIEERKNKELSSFFNGIKTVFNEIDSMKYRYEKNGEYVYVKYTYKLEQKINVTADSTKAIVKDVVAQIRY